MEKRNPWAWIPSLYFAEGLPYVVVMTLSVIMYKRLGVSNTDIALFTSWLYFPWVIKPIWSPFVDLIKTKRWWIYSMQLLNGRCGVRPSRGFLSAVYLGFLLVDGV
jgi:PAT family beta-lactamase induction signal transducer AmpG